MHYDNLCKESPIVLRSILSEPENAEAPALFRFRFGNGSKKGLAAMLIWFVLAKHLDSEGPKPEWRDPGMQDLVTSLFAIGTSFELHGDGSDQRSLMAQLVRQNEDAMVQPVTIFEWVSLITEMNGWKVGDTLGQKRTRGAIEAAIGRVLSEYHEHPEVKAYDEVLRAEDANAGGRKRQRKAAIPIEDLGTGIRIGNRRKACIQNVLQGATPKSLSIVQKHLHEYKMKDCVFSEEHLCWPWLWVASSPPPLPAEDRPPLLGDLTGPPGLTTVPLDLEGPLTDREHEALVAKAVAIYEGLSMNLPDAVRSRCRFKEDEWAQMRRVVVFWERAGRAATLGDKPPVDFAEIEEAILTTNTLDVEIDNLLRRGPRCPAQ